jgi:hypothetical protein
MSVNCLIDKNKPLGTVVVPTLQMGILGHRQEQAVITQLFNYFHMEKPFTKLTLSYLKLYPLIILN